MAKHEHNYGPTSHSITDAEGKLVEQLVWSQCRICGAAEDERPAGAPDPINAADKAAARESA